NTNRRRALANSSFLGLLIAGALSWIGQPAHAIIRYWQEGGTYWSNPNNWLPVGGPQDGDDLCFTDYSKITDPAPMVNDLTNLVVHSLTFDTFANGDYVTQDWDLSGNPFTLTGSLKAAWGSSGMHPNIYCDIILGADVSFNSDSWNGNNQISLKQVL